MLLTEDHLEFPSLKRGCTGPSEPTLVKTPHCWKSHVVAQLTQPPAPPLGHTLLLTLVLLMPGLEVIKL